MIVFLVNEVEIEAYCWSFREKDYSANEVMDVPSTWPALLPPLLRVWRKMHFLARETALLSPQGDTLHIKDSPAWPKKPKIIGKSSALPAIGLIVAWKQSLTCLPTFCSFLLHVTDNPPNSCCSIWDIIQVKVSGEKMDVWFWELSVEVGSGKMRGRSVNRRWANPSQ